jgi:hypothetical protein
MESDVIRSGTAVPNLEDVPMPSPFPGMDPYLEQEVIWHDFHERFLPAAAAHLSIQVLPRYIVLIDEHVYLHDAETEDGHAAGRPDLAVARGSERFAGEARGAAVGLVDAPVQVRIPEMDEERESFLAVRDRVSRQIITVVELLSPTNKSPGENRLRYLSKRADLLTSAAHLVEIDLLRCGKPMPADDRPKCVYSVLVSRAGERPRAGFWPIGLRDPLPTVPVPLRADEPDAHLDLRAVIDRVYDEAGYRYFLYEHPPDPPLTGADADWAVGLSRRALVEG